MKRMLAVLVVFGALGAAASAGGFSVSFGYSGCGRSYYRPSYHGCYRAPVVYRSYRYCGPSYRHHYYRSYSHYRPSVAYVPRIRYCR